MGMEDLTFVPGLYITWIWGC